MPLHEFIYLAVNVRCNTRQPQPNLSWGQAGPLTDLQATSSGPMSENPCTQQSPALTCWHVMGCQYTHHSYIGALAVVFTSTEYAVPSLVLQLSQLKIGRSTNWHVAPYHWLLVSHYNSSHLTKQQGGLRLTTRGLVIFLRHSGLSNQPWPPHTSCTDSSFTTC